MLQPYRSNSSLIRVCCWLEHSTFIADPRSFRNQNRGNKKLEEGNSTNKFCKRRRPRLPSLPHKTSAAGSNRNMPPTYLVRNRKLRRRSMRSDDIASLESSRQSLCLMNSTLLQLLLCRQISKLDGVFQTAAD